MAWSSNFRRAGSTFCVTDILQSVPEKNLTAEYFVNPAEMLQEKVSAVTDGRMSRVQAAAQPDLLSQEPRLDLPTAPTIPSASEPNQVQPSEMAACSLHNLFVVGLERSVVSFRTSRTLKWFFTSGSCGKSSMRPEQR